ncbi:MAG: DUF1109 domain-containing protein [Pseudomonadota bacterium]
MDTDHLIRTLAADNDWRTPSVRLWLTVGLIIAGAISSMMFMMTLHVRPDVGTAMHNPFFDLKFAVTLGLAIPALAIGLRLARPNAAIGGRIWLLALPVGFLLFGIVAEAMVPQRLSWSARLVGNNARVCMTAIPAMSLPLLVASLLALRHGAPTRPALAGAVAGLIAAGLAATLYASHCTDDSPLFVATWYTLATALVAGVGAFAGARVLRF